MHDHQMVIDEKEAILWVFGGRNVNNSTLSSENEYSGLYRYNLGTRTWNLMRSDIPVATNSRDQLQSRLGHSMLFDSKNRKLVILGGQRNNTFMPDLWTYNVDTKELVLEEADCSINGGPERAFTRENHLL